MKQFRTILKFELDNYFRNKVFVGITVFLVVLIAGVMFFPRIQTLFAGDEASADTQRPVMLVSAGENGGMVEPVFTVSAPTNLTRVTAFDALVHAIESLLNFNGCRQHPEVEKWAVQAVRMIVPALPKVLKMPEDEEERAELSAAATLAGMSIRMSPTALPHLLSFSFCGKASHGAAVAALLPHFWKYYLKEEQVRRQTMLLSGMLGGIAGCIEVLGVYGYYLDNFAKDLGTNGMLAALIVKSNMTTTPFIALFLAVLKAGSMAMQQATDVPKSIVDTVSAIFIIIATMNFVVSLRTRRKAEKAAAEKRPQDPSSAGTEGKGGSK